MSDLRKLKDRASKLHSEGKLKEAIKLYQQAIEADPAEMACRMKLGDIHRRLGQKELAVAAYEPVAKHYADDGLLLKAIAVCKMILSVDATHTMTQQMLAALYANRGTPMRAEGAAAPAPRPQARAGASVDFGIEVDDSELSEPMIVERGTTSTAVPREPPPVARPSAARAAMELAPGVPTTTGQHFWPPPTAPAGRVVMGAKVAGLGEGAGGAAPGSGWPNTGQMPAAGASGPGWPNTGQMPAAGAPVPGWPASAPGPAPSGATGGPVPGWPASTPVAMGAGAGTGASAPGWPASPSVAGAAGPMAGWPSSAGAPGSTPRGGGAPSSAWPAGRGVPASGPGAGWPPGASAAPVVTPAVGAGKPDWTIPPPVQVLQGVPAAPQAGRAAGASPADLPNPITEGLVAVLPGARPMVPLGRGDAAGPALASEEAGDGSADERLEFEVEIDPSLPPGDEKLMTIPPPSAPRAGAMRPVASPAAGLVDGPGASGPAAVDGGPVVLADAKGSLEEADVGGQPAAVVEADATGSLEEVVEAELEARAPRVEAPQPAPGSGTNSRPSSGEDGFAQPQIPLFSDLSPEAFIEILVKMQMREMAPGEFVIREGELGTSFFVLAQGKVRVSRRSPEGGETILAYLTDGAFFGEMALLQDGARIASVIAEEDSQIFEISKGVLDQVVAQYPSVAKVLRNFYTQRLLSTTMATHPLFRPFGPKERRSLIELFKSRPFRAGEVILEEEKRGEGLYLLLTGILEVSKRKDGAPVAIAELTSGDMFGEISLLTGQPTVATVRALTDCFVLRLSKKHFDEVIMTHPQVLELVSQISEERQLENNAIFGPWGATEGIALV